MLEHVLTLNEVELALIDAVAVAEESDCKKSKKRKRKLELKDDEDAQNDYDVEMKEQEGEQQQKEGRKEEEKTSLEGTLKMDNRSMDIAMVEKRFGGLWVINKPHTAYLFVSIRIGQVCITNLRVSDDIYTHIEVHEDLVSYKALVEPHIVDYASC